MIGMVVSGFLVTALAAFSPSPQFTPKFAPTWGMQQSTWVMACNYSDFLLPQISSVRKYSLF